MPLPWKKAGISRLVVDHLNSAKQGASLVVETNFPTSIVDLFVKNRDGLNKRSSKKKNYKKSLAGDSTIDDDDDDSFDQISSSSFPASPPKSLTYRGSFFTNHCLAPSSTISRNPTFSCSPPLYATPSHSFSRSPLHESFDPPPVIEKAGVAKKVFAGLLKILFLIVLALGKKQFAIGITVSAFLLLILEIIGKWLCRLLKQCQSAHTSFRHFLQLVVCSSRSENEIDRIEEDPLKNQTDEEEEDNDDEVVEEDNSKFSYSNIVPNLSHCESLHMDWISGIIMAEASESSESEEEEEETPRYINKNPKNRSLQIKSKIKKLWVTKKKQEDDSIYDSNEESEEEEAADEKSKKNLKKEIKKKINASLYLPQGFKKIMPNKLKKISMKKKKKPSFLKRKNMSVYDEEDTYSQFIGSLYEPEETYSQFIGSLYEPESSTSSSIRDDDDVSDSSSVSDSSEDIEMVESPKKETVVFPEKETTTMWTTKKTSLVCLIPIILVGLEGGRFWAIVFTLLCCLVWKFVRYHPSFFNFWLPIFDQR